MRIGVWKESGRISDLLALWRSGLRRFLSRCLTGLLRHSGLLCPAGLLRGLFNLFLPGFVGRFVPIAGDSG